MAKSRMEAMLEARLNGEVPDICPRSRDEALLLALCQKGTGGGEVPDICPRSRDEALLLALCQNGTGSGGATEPYVEYTTDSDGNITAAKLFGFTHIPSGMFAFAHSGSLGSSHTYEYLREVDFSNSPALKSIADYAFYGCTNLALTSLPEGLTSIGQSAFSGCTNLALTSLPEGITSIGNLAFSRCTNLALTSLPEGLTSISDNAFSGCTNLALTSLPEGLTRIGQSAFSGCTNLALTSLPEGLTSIGASAFSGCTSLAITRIPANVTTMNNTAFYNCTALTRIEICAPKVAAAAFKLCTGLETVWIRSTCTTIVASSSTYATFHSCNTSLAIYAEPTEKPSGWGSYFNKVGTSGSTDVTVTYGQTERPW